MKRNMQIVFTTLDGTSISDERGKLVTMQSVAVNALLAPHQSEDGISGQEKFNRYQLASKIHAAADEVELDAEQISLLKRLVALHYTPLIVGQFYNHIEKENQP